MSRTTPTTFALLLIAISTCMAGGGCAATATESASAQADATQALIGFDRDADVRAIATTPPDAVISRKKGVRGVFIPGGTREVKIDLARASKAWPLAERWALLGARVRSERDEVVACRYEVDGRVVQQARRRVNAGRTTLVSVDLTAMPPASRTGAVGRLTLLFESRGEPGSAVVEDVVLVDNARTLAEGAPIWAGFRILRRGHRTMVERDRSFRAAVLNEEGSPSGWTPMQVCAARAVFRAADSGKTLAIYADGRAYRESSYLPQSASAKRDPAFEAQHLTPSQVIVLDPVQGRPECSAPGDSDNDGYDESLGVYCVRAAGPRLDLKIIPRTAVLANPVLEISGLPAGAPTVTIEGRLVSTTLRLPDGNLLVELPVRLQRPTIVNVLVN